MFVYIYAVDMHNSCRMQKISLTVNTITNEIDWLFLAPQIKDSIILGVLNLA